MKYENIEEEEVLRKAKSRALYLLGDMPRTEKQLRDKLEKTGYPLEVIEKVIAYVKEYHYIDDLQYARDYIVSKSRLKSKRMVLMELKRKGIAREILQETEDCFPKEAQEELLEQLIAKKKMDLKTASREEIHKLHQHLLRKGFSYEEIRSVIERVRSDLY